MRSATSAESCSIVLLMAHNHLRSACSVSSMRVYTSCSSCFWQQSGHRGHLTQRAAPCRSNQSNSCLCASTPALRGFHQVRDCMPEFTMAVGERLNPKTFESIGPQTAFLVMNTPYPTVRYGQRYGGRNLGVIATSQAEICRVNE